MHTYGVTYLFYGIIWYFYVFLKWNYIVLQNIALCKYGIVCILHCILHDTANIVQYVNMVISYIVLYCIALYYKRIELQQISQISSLLPGFRAPFKRGKTCEFIQETRSWNNSLAVTDASQGKSSTAWCPQDNQWSIGWTYTAWSWTWKLKKIIFQQFPTVQTSL